MNKLTNKSIIKKDLEVFTKDELIYFILHSGSLWNPLEIIYQKRMDNNFEKSMEITIEVKKLLDKMSDKNFKEVYQISLEIEKLQRTQGKLRRENDCIMKILYD